MQHIQTFVLTFLLVLQVSFILVSSNEVPRPKGSVTINGRDYYFSERGENTHVRNGTLFCNSMGMKLVTFETSTELQDVTDFLNINGMTDVWWTSGKEYFDDGWIWTSTGDLFYNNDASWSAGHPVAGECRCVTITAVTVGLISDECQKSHSLICEQI
ncbi:hypothetical protein B566_EDAN014434 [Ephemera danica]|nr:hypothetical protein B566_EDAN014434 [Ephemera danica]